MTEFTVGVEEEYQLIDPVTGDLRSDARVVLGADWTGEIRHEMQESTIEIGTRVCDDGAALQEEMVRLRLQAATVAASHDLAIAAAGVHPTSQWEAHEMSAGERYRRILRQYGRIARDEHNFGMHVHVAVPERHDRARLMSATRVYLPHLLALSSSSPVIEGADTGYASFRTIMWRRWPHTGAPPYFADMGAYEQYVEALQRAAVIEDARDLYWMVRPHPVYPTLEFRACDVCPSLADALAIARLTRIIVCAAARNELPDSGVATETAFTEPLLQDDTWRAARHGLHAEFVRPDAKDGRRSVRAELHDLLAQLSPLADEMGEGEMVQGIERIMERGTGADRMRAVVADSGGSALPHWIAAETVVGTGIDRRSEQRPSAPGAKV